MLQRTVAVSSGLNTLSEQCIYIPKNIEKRKIQKMNTISMETPDYCVEIKKRGRMSFVILQNMIDYTKSRKK